MGNSYTVLSTQDAQDVLLNSASTSGFKSSASSYMSRPPVNRPAHHSDDILCMCAQRPGMVVTGSKDKTMKLNNVDTGEVYMTWKGHEKDVTKVFYKFRSNKHFLVSGSRDEKVMLWNFMEPQPLRTFAGHSKTVTGVAANEDGHLFSASRDTSIRKWDAETGKQIAMNFLQRNTVTHLTHNTNTQLLAQSSEDKTIKLWDERNLELASEFPKKHNIQTYVEWLPEGVQLLACSQGCNGDGGEITLYDVRNRKILREMRGHESTATSACLLGWPANNSAQQFTQRRLILSTSHDRSLRVWNLDEGNCLWTQEGEHNSALYASLAFADGCVVAAGAEGSLITMQMHARAGRPLLQTLAYTTQKKEKK